MKPLNESKERLLILGAAGRDFHNFNILYRENSSVEVVGFTATQISGIANRTYPPTLAGNLYKKGLPIWSEEDLEKIIQEQKVTCCIMSYSDQSHQAVMALSARCQSSGADFKFVSYHKTWIPSHKPVLAVTGVRTGCGKSQISAYIIDILTKEGLKVVLVRHPMPYGDLEKSVVQRFEKLEDLEREKVTIEEREEYEQHLCKGVIVYAGVDYEKILRKAEEEADVILWDGGNNDTPFFKPSLWIVVADPHRSGHELSYYPGDINFRCADVIIINKVNTGSLDAIKSIQQNAKNINPNAIIINTDSDVTVDNPDLVSGKRVLVVEDGPTLTHGGMEYGAGNVAAIKFKAKSIVDPRKFVKGSMKEVFLKFPHLKGCIPAMGYSKDQEHDLEASINAVDCDTVLIASPVNLTKIMKIQRPAVVVSYQIKESGSSKPLIDCIKGFVRSRKETP
jgi:predicted GTPase